MADVRCQLVVEWTNEANGVERLSFDASVRETYESTSEVSEHPVETGVVIADHVKANPNGFTAEVVVTNAPIVDPQDHADGAVSSVRSASVTVGDASVTATTRQWSAPFDRVRSVDEALRALRDAKQLVKVYSGLRVMESMQITRYTPERSVDTGDALHFTLEVKKVRIVTTRRVNAPRRVRRRDNRGPQAAQPAQPSSMLSNLTGLGRRTGL